MFQKHESDILIMNQDSFQYYFESGPQNSFLVEYLAFPFLIFLMIILVYNYLKKRILRDEKEDLESLKLLQELLEQGTISNEEFLKKKNRITSKW